MPARRPRRGGRGAERRRRPRAPRRSGVPRRAGRCAIAARPSCRGRALRLTARRLVEAARDRTFVRRKPLRRPAVLELAPDAAEVGRDLRREEVRRAVGQLDRRRADVAAEREMPDAERARELVELLADGRRRSRDDVALLAELLPRLVLAHVLARVADLRDDAGAHRRLADVAGRARRPRIEVEALVEEVVDVRPPLALARGVGVADADLLEERGAVRVGVLPERGEPLPVAFHHLLRALVPAEREVAVVVVVLRAEVPGL